MKALIFALLLASTAVVAEDGRQLVRLPPPAQEALRQEMLDNLLAVNEILSLMGAGKVREAGDVAESRLGRSAMPSVPAHNCHTPCLFSRRALRPAPPGFINGYQAQFSPS